MTSRTTSRTTSERRLLRKLLSYAEDARKKIKYWPRYGAHWTVLSGQLSNIMALALTVNVRGTYGLENWTWDEYYARFRFEVVSTFHMSQDGTVRPVRMASWFHFDPKLDTVKELDRVSAEIKAYADQLLEMQQAYHNHKEHDADAADA